MYRKDINCLRGFSILLITLYHFYPQKIYGGFIGVDILFCISGYLIYYSINNNKNYSYLTFYSNRIKRICPSQVIVLLVILYFYRGINPIDFSELCSECMYSLLFYLNNYYQWRNFDYLSQDKGKFDTPILHFWTLSIEFQFYIIAPFVTILFSRRISSTVIFLFCLLCYSVYYTNYNYVNSYFSSLIRFTDFIIGISSIHNNKSRYNNILKVCLLILIIVFTLTNTFIYYYPGIIILLPLLFTYLYLSSPQNYFFNNYLLDYAGSISFSLYLIHYPFIIFKHNVFYMLLMVCISVIFYIFIEKKSRNIQCNNITTIISYIFFLCIFYISINKMKYLKIMSKKEKLYNSVWNYNNRIIKKCIFTDKYYNLKNIKSYILLLGDSHIQHFFPAINYYLQNNNMAAIAILFWGNRIINNDYLILKAIFKLINSPLMIMISFRLSNFQSIFDITKFNKKFGIFISFLKIYCENILLLEETPHHSYNPYKEFYSNKNSYCIINTNCSITNYKNINNMNITLVPIRSLFCNKLICKDVINDTLVYADANHITLEFSLQIKYYFYNLLQKHINIRQSMYLLSECVISQQKLYNDFIKKFYTINKLSNSVK